MRCQIGVRVYTKPNVSVFFTSCLIIDIISGDIMIDLAQLY